MIDNLAGERPTLRHASITELLRARFKTILSDYEVRHINGTARGQIGQTFFIERVRHGLAHFDHGSAIRQFTMSMQSLHG